MNLRKPSTEAERPLLDTEADQGRRHTLRSLAASMAAVATSLIAGRANAGSCGCDENCQFSGSECLISHGLCYDNGKEQYFHLYTLRNGSPSGGCCVSPGGYVCGYLCSPGSVC